MNLLYISRPCTSCGQPELNRILARRYAEKYKALGYHAINPLDVINLDCTEHQRLVISLKLLDICRVILMCGEWEKSERCKYELEHAKDNDIEIIYDGGVK